MSVQITGGSAVALEPTAGGFFQAEAEARPGMRYRISIDGQAATADPASRYQPYGAHCDSEIVDLSAFHFHDERWHGIDLRDFILYELHVGTFTKEGTLDAAAGQLDLMKALGVTAVELMPVAQFPGERNWGYDGVFPYAVQNAYGGPQALQRFVGAAHERGLAVILDVVYNHLGPEGNVLSRFGPYFTDRYRTPWGPAVNFDGADSDAVRAYFIENALYWLREFHLDGLRLDAVHGIYDLGARHFLLELHDAVAALQKSTGRKLHLIAESDLNDSKVLRASAEGGYGMSAQWSDDFHHALHVELTGEKNGYYADFNGIADLAIAIRDGWRYVGDYSPSRRRHHGNSSAGLSPDRFVVCSQNHDQIGNRARGDRLTATLTLAQLRLAAAVTLLSPFIPLLFMGEESAERKPFPYFTSHSDADLVEAVRRGRREEFASFGYAAEDVPDPQGEETFRSAVLDHEHRPSPQAIAMRRFYAAIIRLRKEAGIAGVWPSVRVDPVAKWLELRYENSKVPLTVLFNFGGVELDAETVGGGSMAESEVVFDSSDVRWAADSDAAQDRNSKPRSRLTLAPHSAVVLTQSRGSENIR